jgi:hypothetical protein
VSQVELVTESLVTRKPKVKWNSLLRHNVELDRQMDGQHLCCSVTACLHQPSICYSPLRLLQGTSWTDWRTHLPSVLNPLTNYGTVQEKMVAHMPRMHLTYQEDNIKAWEIIQDSLHNTEAFHWIQHSERRRDRHSAYLALTTHHHITTHYLGAFQKWTT